MSLLDAFTLCVGAVYLSRSEKLPTLEKMRVNIEISKQLLRTVNEMHILDDKNYLRFAGMIQEISKMTNGWIKYLETAAKINSTQNPPQTKSIGGL